MARFRFIILRHTVGDAIAQGNRTKQTLNDLNRGRQLKTAMSRLLAHRLNLLPLMVGTAMLLLASFALPADNLSLSKAAVVGFYPELKGRDLHVAISDAGLLDTPGSLASFSMEVRQLNHPVAAKEQCPALLCLAFEFPVHDLDLRILHLSAVGAVVNTDRTEKLTQLVDSHPGWSDEEVLNAVATAGAHFGPTRKHELLARLPINSLKPLLGDISVVSADFGIRDQAQREAHLPAADLMWPYVSSRI